MINKATTTQDRIKIFICFKGLSVKRFEELTGLSNGYINSMKKGFGEQKLYGVLKVFPELNRDWLVYGEGEMLVQSQSLTQSTDEHIDLQVADDTLVAELRSKIERLESKIDNLNQELGEKNALIKLMRQGSMESI